MSLANETNTDLYWLAGIVGIAVLLLLLVGSVVFFMGFSRQLKYLNNEIRRTRGVEREYWIREKRRLWLSLLPFIKY